MKIFNSILFSSLCFVALGLFAASPVHAESATHSSANVVADHGGHGGHGRWHGGGGGGGHHYGGYYRHGGWNRGWGGNWDGGGAYYYGYPTYYYYGGYPNSYYYNSPYYYDNGVDGLYFQLGF